MELSPADDQPAGFFSYDSQRLGQGRENAKLFLKENADVAAAIEKAIRESAGLIASQLEGVDSVSEEAAEG